MAIYRVALEMEVKADSPLEAASKVEECIREGEHFAYYVQEESGHILSVDLDEACEEDMVCYADDYEPLISK